MLLSKILRKEPDCIVTETVSGGDAWRCLLKGERPDLCIFDIMMPELDGLELVRHMRADERFKAVPVIFCSALNERSAVVQAAMLAVNYYIVKPYTESLVLDQVRKVKSAISRGEMYQNEMEVCTRLGIDLETYRELMGHLADELLAQIVKIKAELAMRDLKKSALLVNSSKGAATNLGVNHLVEELNWLESELTAFGTSLFSEKEKIRNYIAFDSWHKLHGPGVKNALARLEETAQQLKQKYGSTEVQDAKGAEVVQNEAVATQE